MATDRRHQLAVTFLTRSGCLLTAVAVVAGLWGRLPADSGESRPIELSGTRLAEHPAAASDAIVDGEVQVAVAETYSLSPEDWQRLLSGLSAELRLGLAVEVSVPGTTSNGAPPTDSLNRLLWAKGVLRSHQIELRIEQDAIRLVPLAAPVDPPAEA